MQKVIFEKQKEQLQDAKLNQQIRQADADLPKPSPPPPPPPVVFEDVEPEYIPTELPTSLKKKSGFLSSLISKFGETFSKSPRKTKPAVEYYGDGGPLYVCLLKYCLSSSH